MLELNKRFVCDVCNWRTAQPTGVVRYTCRCGSVVIVPSRGLGDTIHKITTALHIPHCGGCEQRREMFNNLVPYKDKP